MATSAIIIGTAATCARIEAQLALLDDPPRTLGWVIDETRPAADPPVLGSIENLPSIIRRVQPQLALVSLPAVMNERITSIRTRLRRMGVTERFMPTLEDQVAGIGPRTHLDIDVDALLDRPPRVLDEDAVKSVVAGRRVLITGAGGSIGSELARIAASFQPAELVLMDRSENALFEIDRQIARTTPLLPRRALLHDVVDAPGTLRLVTSVNPELIFHAAAHKHVPMMEDHPAAAVQNNLFGTKAVADAAAAVDAERFVLISSDKAVNPRSIMGATKRFAEQYVQHCNEQHETSFAVVRFGNVLGSSGSVLDVWSRQVADGGPLTITDPAMTRYFMTIPEAASLVIQSAALSNQARDSGAVFLLDMGEPVRIIDLARRFVEMHGLMPILPDYNAPYTDVRSISIVFTGIRPGEKLHEQLAFDAEAMQPTQHPDINIWCLQPPESRYIEQLLRTLSPRACQNAAQVSEMIWSLLSRDRNEAALCSR